MKWMRIFNLILLLVVVGVYCSSNAPTKNITDKIQTPSDTLVKPRDVSALVGQARTSTFNNFSRFIAGLPQLQEDNFSKSEQDSLWIKHAQKLNSKWNLMTSKRTAKLNVWAAQEVPSSMRSSEVLFYPFSGADILNANLLFPNTKLYYMFGLEPVGHLPDVLLNNSGRDSLKSYFNALNVSLNAITNFSFFRTKSMAVDFKADELNGTIHLLLLFLARNGNDIADIRYVYIDDQGKQQDNINQKVKKNDGVEIVFVDSAHQTHFVTYYSVNLDNAHMAKNAGMESYIKNLGGFNTYLKAASYLMHNASFSMIRTHILDQSKYLLQDDSGIPYKFFNDKNKWNASFYGVYVPPIHLFENYMQNDLKAAYQDSTANTKPLNFGIGYNFKQSNLMLFERK